MTSWQWWYGQRISILCSPWIDTALSSYLTSVKISLVISWSPENLWASSLLIGHRISTRNSTFISVTWTIIRRLSWDRWRRKGGGAFVLCNQRPISCGSPGPHPTLYNCCDISSHNLWLKSPRPCPSWPHSTQHYRCGPVLPRVNNRQRWRYKADILIQYSFNKFLREFDVARNNSKITLRNGHNTTESI